MENSAIEREAFEQLLASVAGDRDFLGELIDVYLTDSCDQLARLSQSLAAGDLEPFRRAAHSLKSNSANFGATSLSAQARELETMARAGSLEGAAPRLAAVNAEFERVSRELAELRTGP